jgi:hypothetical protein
MSMILDGSNGVTFNDASLQGAAASPFGLKNRLINADMRIDQRNAGASVSATTSSWSVDRWQAYASQTSKYTIQQSSTAPTGFANSLLVTSSSAYSVTSTDIFFIRQIIEGYNIADLGFGTANAKIITLSFWVRSSLTGTFGGALTNDSNRAYPFTYTISAANTWEQKTVTLTADTSGTWGSTNNAGLAVIFSFGAGSTRQGTAGAWTGTNYYGATGETSIVGTSGATFYITGVQLEQNTSATPFERRLYNQELANCQRYCYKDGGNVANQYSNTPGGYYDANYVSFGVLRFPVTMRTAPSLTQYGTPVIWQTASEVSTTMTSWNITINGNPSTQLCYLTANKTSHGITPSILHVVRYTTTSDYFIFSSEL